jgi:hypothetical protein
MYSLVQEGKCGAKERPDVETTERSPTVLAEHVQFH